MIKNDSTERRSTASKAAAPPGMEEKIEAAGAGPFLQGPGEAVGLGREVPAAFESHPERRVCFAMTGDAGDDAALARTLRLCQHTGSELLIVGVHARTPEFLRGILVSCGLEQAAEIDEQTRRDALAQLVDTARRAGVPVSGTLWEGPPAIAIMRAVQRHPCDLVVKAAQASAAAQRLLFGHTDLQLIRKCPCPVWIEKGGERPRFNRILAAVDPLPMPGDPEFDPNRDQLNRSILELARQLARLEQAELHVVHVWQFPLEAALQSRAGLTTEEVAAVGQTVRQRHDLALAKLLGPYLRDVNRVHLVKGVPADEIARIAAEESVDAVVLGTVCRTGIAGWLIGNTAETVLSQLDCSIVALKPPGFVSPVTLPSP